MKVAALPRVYMRRCPKVVCKNHSRPLPLEGADERSEAGLASLNVGVPFHAANLHPFGAPPSKGRREKEGLRVSS